MEERNDNIQLELLKLETMKERLDVFREIFMNGASNNISYSWTMENVLGFSTKESKSMSKKNFFKKIINNK